MSQVPSHSESSLNKDQQKELEQLLVFTRKIAIGAAGTPLGEKAKQALEPASLDDLIFFVKNCKGMIAEAIGKLNL